MSVYVMSLVWRVDLPANRKVVALKLADCAGDDGRNAFPSIDRMARECGLGARTVQRILTQLRQAGLIAVEAPHDRGRHRPTIYRFDLQRLSDEAERGAAVAPRDPERGAAVTPRDPERGAAVTPGGVPTTTERGAKAWHPNHQEPSDNHQGGEIVVDDNPHDGEADVDWVVADFLGRRNRHWPDHPDLPAPATTLATQARARLAAGLMPLQVAGVCELGMARMAREGKRPPGSLAAFCRSLDDAERRAEKAAAEAAPVPAWKRRYLAAYRGWDAGGRRGAAPDADDYRPGDGHQGGTP